MQAATSHHLDELDGLTYLPLVGHVVHQLAARYPRRVDRTAMWNAGAAGLLYAVQRAESTGMFFSQHAIRVIRAAVLDTIDIAAPAAVAITDEALADGFEVDVDQLRTLRSTQLETVTVGHVPDAPTPPAPTFHTPPRPLPVPLVARGPRWVAPVASVYG